MKNVPGCSAHSLDLGGFNGRPRTGLGKLFNFKKQRIPSSPPGEADGNQLFEIVQRLRDGRLRTNVGKITTLTDAVAALTSTERRAGKTVIRVLA
ncbi:NADPH:quinone reductase-like Zn-dependent oxidoreductase [Rhizobium sp. BK619]|nr:NADPH:quinone reductase-like Zn-dependent oxidoreductase [Rhizobium sp. BK619]